MFYAIYGTDGWVDRVVQCSPNLVSVQCKGNEQYIEVDTLSFIGYVKDGAATNLGKPPTPYCRFDTELMQWVDWRDDALKALHIREERDQLIARTDWTQSLDIPESTRVAYQTYRQALRDIPQQTGFPDNIVWPTKPE